MITRVVAFFLSAILLAGVCLAADKPVTDDAIADQVMIRLAADPDVKGGALKVDCKNGVVTITGSVENTRAKDKASKLTKKVKGVKQVVNNTTVGDKPAVK